MKCMHCGAEVEKHTFCMYCGKRLSEQHVTAKPVRAASGVMRFRQRAGVSDSALPEVQKSRPAAARMELESLKRISSESARVERGAAKMGAAPQQIPASRNAASSQSDPSMRQSRELEALLRKLNAPENNYPEADDSDIGGDENLSSLEVDLDAPSMSDASMNDSFFLQDESETAVSGPIPTGSGSFARVPSGGFRLVADTVKEAFRKAAGRAKRAARDIRSGEMPKKKIVAACAICLCVVGAGAAILASSGGSETAAETPAPAAEIASQSAVAGNEDFAIIPIQDSGESYNDEEIAQMYDFDDDAFAIPDLTGEDAGSGDEEATAAAAAAAAAAGKKTAKDNPASADDAQAQAQARAAAAAPAAAPGEKRLYGRKDNVFAGAGAAKSVKTNRSCIMREGPASRFGLVKEVPSGASIKVVAMTEEDWILEKGGLWSKNGMTKLGPGAQFADAVKGMSLPQPKSRVISSSNWRYIQYGDVYGYVGPACFK